MAPLDLSGLGHVGGNLVSVAFGVGFGFLLERAGFGNARKLASQFYLDDQTVLKVMFTAIVVAMVLIYWTTGLGWLDFERIWVNPTYLWPGIIGGLLLGVGFIIGGYCPGTSIVAAATLKLDGLVFFLGCLLGIFVFGATVPWYQAFWEQSGFMGRYTIPEWLGLSYGAVVLLVVLMALGMFAGAEWLESLVPQRRPRLAGEARPPGGTRAGRRGGPAGSGGGLAVYAQAVPDPARPRLLRQAEQQIASRERHIEPAELLSLMHNNQVVVEDARRPRRGRITTCSTSSTPPWSRQSQLQDRLGQEPACRRDQGGDVQRRGAGQRRLAKELMARGVRNVYILAGGINRWLETFGPGTAPRIASQQSRRPLLRIPVGPRGPLCGVQSRPMDHARVDLHSEGQVRSSGHQGQGRVWRIGV